MNISIIIPNYNGRHLLEKNLPIVFIGVEVYCRKYKKKAEILVVDDASTDTSVAFLQNHQNKFVSEHISFICIQNKTNSGFARTVNIGVANSHGDDMVLLNTDVVPEKNFLEPLLNTLHTKDVFAVGCLDKSIERGKTVERGRGIGKWHEGFLQHAAGSLDKTNTLWVSGGSGAFRKDIWVKIGGMNDLYSPFYWEDIDISYRALKAGYKVLFEKESVVIHEHEEGSIKKEKNEKYVKTIAYRNQIIFVWLNITNKSFILNHILWLPIHILRAMKTKDILFIKAFLMALRILPIALMKRKSLTKHFVLDDVLIISQNAI